MEICQSPSVCIHSDSIVQARSGKVVPPVELVRKQGQYFRSIQSMGSLTSQNWPILKHKSHWVCKCVSSWSVANIPRKVTLIRTQACSSPTLRYTGWKFLPHWVTRCTLSIKTKASFARKCQSWSSFAMGIISGPIPITSQQPSQISLHRPWPSRY